MRLILPVIVVSQFFCTSVWFAGNSVISDLIQDLHPGEAFLANITSAIQFGFITGTLLFAIFTVSDRFSPSRVFFVSSILAAVFNLGITAANIGSSEILLFRFLTGFFLAGIYPVGMKLASDHYQAGLGRSLGFLVGALVLGTAFPHLLKNYVTDLPWRVVIFSTSLLSLIGGLGILLLVPDGPYRKQGQKLRFTEFLKGFSQKNFRSASFGYFGHMWELYTFWAFVPVMLSAYNHRYPEANINIPLQAFLIIASGGIACVISGLISNRVGAKKTAVLALFLSCSCCLTSPVFLISSSEILFTTFLFFWAAVVVADSPLFSTLVANHAPVESRGSSLTIVNCIGFAITIISIQVISFFFSKIDSQYIYLLLAPGPVLGLWALAAKTHNVEEGQVTRPWRNSTK